MTTPWTGNTLTGVARKIKKAKNSDTKSHWVDFKFSVGMDIFSSISKCEIVDVKMGEAL